MTLTGLSRFGIHKRTIVRTVAVDDDGYVICPECGYVIEGTRGTQHISGSCIVDQNIVGDDNRVPTLGYRCKNHAYPLVVPVDYDDLRAGWSPVPVQFADGETRPVGIPTREVQSESQ